MVLLRSNTRISHSRGIVELGEKTEKERIPYVKNMQKYVAMPAMAKKLHIVQEKRMNQIAEDSYDMEFNGIRLNTIEMNDPSVGIITSGICYQYVKEALPEASILKMGLINPLPVKLIKEFASKVDKLYMIEEGDPVIEDQLKAAGVEFDGGKDMFTIQGEYSANMIRKPSASLLPRRLQ